MLFRSPEGDPIDPAKLRLVGVDGIEGRIERRSQLALEGDEVSQLTLTQAAELFGVPVASPHHALDDALVTAQLFLVTASKLAERDRGLVKHLLRPEVASSPPLLARPRAPM